MAPRIPIATCSPRPGMCGVARWAFGTSWRGCSRCTPVSTSASATAKRPSTSRSAMPGSGPEQPALPTAFLVRCVPRVSNREGSSMNFRKSAAAVGLAALATFSAAGFAANDKKDVKAIEAAASGAWRSNDEKARDAYRHPVDALAFWGLKPGMTILEVQPGGGWWSNILAPYARATHGEFYATAPNVSNPAASEGAKKAREGYINKFSDASIYGKVNIVDWGKNAAPLPADKFDFVLVAREIHNWIHGGSADADLANLFAATKPGGVLAIEEHRAKATQDPSTYNGY